ncbi:hypothetical protein M9H77_36222 [Catharanthus roseus]|uniref:Uncharacterized protein n=1 Tax=Catharanthus roseus TaxID=4058 RepID=A0ACB9ZTE3_CATRO|nr:hypothetical protein M9H77_36222 [Catharanthus roseus]
MSTQAQALTPFGEESSNSQHDDPLRLIMQELQSLRDEMRNIRRDVTNLSNQQREVSPHGSLNVTTPRSNGPLNCSRTTEQVATTKPPTSNFKPWPKKEEAPRGTFQSPTKPKMEERGHYASSCPTKRALIFREDLNGWIEKEEDESNECVEGEENGEDDEHVDLNPLGSDDDVLSLVTIRALSAQTFDDNMIEQRENIFHSKCKVEGRIANLIIDSGSCVNVASAYLVEKLKLPTTKHDKPYKLHWLNDSGEIKVLRQVVVPIEMGAYKDEILCDVVPMQACHLLLGRPWQFDRKSLHNGEKNTYSFVKDGRTFTMNPLTTSTVRDEKKR